MKSRYMPILYVGMVLAAFAAGFHSLDRISRSLPRNPTKKSTATALPTAVPEATLSDIRNMLEKQEYHISPDQQTKRLQSPNRAHNLRAYYEPGKLTVQARVDTTGNRFKLELVNEGIFADGKPLHAPQRNARTSHHDNQVQIMHDAFTEEFINNEDGVRQNFIIHQAPAATRQLQVRMSAKGLKVSQAEGNELRFYKEITKGIHQNELVYSDLKCWDANKKPLTANLAYANNRIQITVDVTNAAYPVTIDPIIANGNPQNANKIIEINQSNMWLGFSVSSAGDVNGDGYSDIIAGAPQYDLGQTNEGAAFVFKGSAAGLSLAGVTLECNQDSAQMGYSVASAGDFNGDGYSDVLVGIPFYDLNKKNAGLAKLYYGSPQGISANAVPLNFSPDNAGDNYGMSVATAGDINADGFSDILIGGPQMDYGQTNEGIVSVIYGAQANWTTAQQLEGNQPDAMFGFSVASAGDVNGDGYSDIIVGARLFDYNLPNDGAAFVYRGTANGLDTSSPTILSSGQQDARMGHKVSSAGDVNGDGYSDILLSAYMYDGEYLNEGRVYLHLGSPTGISSFVSRVFEGKQIDARIGSSLACAGDVNGDGYADILLGAQYFDNGQNNEGAVFVYHGSTNGIVDNYAAMLESNQGEGWFGTAVSSAGDVNGDGYSDILVGCYTFDNGQNDEGHVFLYNGGADGLGTKGATSLSVNKSGAQFGLSIASAGDVDGDGYDDIIAGAPTYDFNGATEGIAILYYGSITGINVNNKLVLTSIYANGYFGGSVAGAGDVNGDGYSDVLIGAKEYTIGVSHQGVAFVYYGSSGGLGTSGFAITVNKADADFGFCVSGAGDLNRDGYADFIVGSPSYSPTGAMFVYLGNSGNPGNGTLIAGYQNNSHFGEAICAAGDVDGDGYGDIIAGAWGTSLLQQGEGAAYIYHGIAAGINPNPQKVLESDQNDAKFGISVSSAGDVNGDGFADVIVGGHYFDHGQVNEGIAVIYYGTSNGISTTSPALPTLLEVNVANSNFGSSVSSAGDVNGDGYSDVIVGASSFSNGQIGEGKLYVFHGSPSGITTTSSFGVEGDEVDAHLGRVVAGAGDVNGDGYSDVIIGLPFRDNGQYLNAGTMSVYYGNNGKGLRNNVRLYNSDLDNPISYTQFKQLDFGIGLFTRSFIGKSRAKLVWEIRANGTAFSKVGSDPISTSTESSGESVNFANLALSGTEWQSVIDKNNAGTGTKVRARVRYSPVLAITGQMYGPWRYVQRQLTGYNNAPVPEEAMAETIKRKAEPEAETSVTLFPNPASDQLSIQVADPSDIRAVRLYDTGGKPVFQSQRYERDIDVSKLPGGVYILMLNRANGTSTSHRVLIRR